jgi:hypothetical protein
MRLKRHLCKWVGSALGERDDFYSTKVAAEDLGINYDGKADAQIYMTILEAICDDEHERAFGANNIVARLEWITKQTENIGIIETCLEIIEIMQVNEICVTDVSLLQKIENIKNRKEYVLESWL